MLQLYRAGVDIDVTVALDIRAGSVKYLEVSFDDPQRTVRHDGQLIDVREIRRDRYDVRRHDGERRAVDMVRYQAGRIPSGPIPELPGSQVVPIAALTRPVILRICRSGTDQRNRHQPKAKERRPNRP